MMLAEMMSTARENPVWIRESRDLSRAPTTALLVSAYVAAVVVVACVLFSRAAVGSPDHDPGIGQAARIAYHAFSFQIALVALIGPALGAAGISRDRAAGTFESLLIGTLGPTSVVRAKLAGSVAYLALFVFAALPVYLLIVLNAGLGITALLAAEILTLATAVAGVSLGLLLGALMSTPPLATMAACGLAVSLCLDVVLAGLVPAPGSGLPQTRAQLLAGRSGVDTTAVLTDRSGAPLRPRRETISPLRLVNPLYALHKTINDPVPAVDPQGIPLARVLRSLVPGDSSWSTWGPRLKLWHYSTGASLLAALFLVSMTSRLVAVPGWRSPRPSRRGTQVDRVISPEQP